MRGAPFPHFPFQVKDHVQRDSGISGDPLGRIPVSQEVPRNLFNCIPTFKCHINHIHSLRHEVSGTKITQFYLVLQYPEYGVARKIAEIGLAVERIDSAEPLGEATMIVRKRLGMMIELLHLDNRDGLLVEIQLHVLVAELHRVAVLAGFFPRKRVEELECEQVQVFEDGRLVFLHHVAGKARHVKYNAILEQSSVFVLHLNGDAVAGALPATFVRQQQVGFGIAVPHFAGDEGVHDLRVLDAVGSVQVERRIYEVGCKGDILLAGENLLEAGVIVDVHVLVFVLLDDGVEVLASFVSLSKHVDKFCEFFSRHFVFRAEARRHSRTGDCPLSTLKTVLWRK